MNPNTPGRALALHAAAAEGHAEVRELIEAHLSAYSGDELLYVLATALETLAVYVVLPAVAGEEDPAAFRRQYKTAATAIVAGPTQEGK